MIPTPEPSALRRVVIDPITRVEGHGKVTLLLDQDDRVREARFHVTEFRGFERFVQGRFYWEVPVLVERLCGICPVSHHLCASKAMDQVGGHDPLPPAASKLRRLMHYGQIYQNHVLHFFHLCSPDLLLGYDAPVEQRNLFGVARSYPEIARKAVQMRRWGQEVIEAAGGRKIHNTASIPGGMNRNPDPATLARLLAEVETMTAWGLEALDLARRLTREGGQALLEFGSFDSHHASLVGLEGELDLYDGLLRVKDPHGRILLDRIPPEEYLEILKEETRDWSYMKFPYLRALGREEGWYRVGPLSRINNCDRITTPLAEEARQEFMRLGRGRPVQSTMASHWARMIELVHAAEVCRELLSDPDMQGPTAAPPGQGRPRGVAWLEAPRGLLIHDYEVDLPTGQIRRANLVVSTTSNNEAIQRTVRHIAASHLDGRPELTEGLLNHIEVGIRAYDPCLSCATHALGSMPLTVQLLDAEGRILQERSR